MAKALTHLYVAAVTAAAVGLGFWAWQTRAPFVGWWALGAFLVVACALEGLSTQLRLAAKGSTSFIIHMAAALLFGGFWGVLITSISTLLGEFARDSSPLKTIFNVAQRVVTIVVALGIYSGLGGSTPPSYLGVSTSL